VSEGSGTHNHFVRWQEAIRNLNPSNDTPEQSAKIFDAKLKKEGMKAAVNYIINSEKGGVLLLDDIDEKTGLSVEKVLESKHPDACTPDLPFFNDYKSMPEFVDVHITEDTVEKVAHHLTGSAGIGGTDSFDLLCWLLKFGGTS